MPPVNAAEQRDLLVRRLDERWSQLQVFDAYYEGDQELAIATRKFRDAYGGLFKALADNYMPLVVDAAAERLKVQGFRFGRDEEADQDAWQMWQANDMDGQANMVHTEAVKLGVAYWMVQPNGDMPRITAEHPSQVIVQCAPGDRRVRQAALKKWADDEFIYANVYLPDRVVKYRTTKRTLALEPVGSAKRWETIGADSNPLGVVPIVPVPNNPSMLRGGRSDLAGGPTRIQDAVNLLLGSMLIGAEYQAYPLRVLLGVDTPKNPDGSVVQNAELKVSQSRLLMFPGDAQSMEVKEFSAADLENLRKAMDGMIGDLAAETRIPIYYFRPQAISNISAEALIGLDAGLVSKTDDKKDAAGEGHEEAMRLAFKAKDGRDPRADALDAETIWKNTESRSQAQVVDAAVKEVVGLQVPVEVAWEKVGYSPQQIDRMKQIQEAEALLNPPPVVPPGVTAPPEQVPGAAQPA